MFLDKGSREICHDRIHGLQQPLTSGHFVQARKDYNKLPTDDVLLKVQEKVEEHTLQLELLFKRFGVEDLFAVWVLHSHFKVPDGFNLVGQTETFDGRRCYWTKRIANNTLDSIGVCAQKIMFNEEKGWVPCELRESSAPDLSQVDPQFFLEVRDYLNKHDLISTLGLECIVPELYLSDTLEFRLPNDELLLVPLKPTEVASLRANYSTATTNYRWSDQGCIKNYCIPDENKKHPDKPNDFPLRKFQISIPSLFQEQYSRICVAKT